MTPARALDINKRLVFAYMLRERICDGVVPDLSDTSLTDAIEASRMVAAMGPRPDPERPGIQIHTCHVEPTRVHRLWFWALAVTHAKEVENG